jgi:hypothetical protein
VAIPLLEHAITSSWVVQGTAVLVDIAYAMWCEFSMLYARAHAKKAKSKNFCKCRAGVAV